VFFFFPFLLVETIWCKKKKKKRVRMDGSIERAQRQKVHAVVGVRAEKWKCTMARVELLTFGVATGGALCLESAMGRSLVVSVVGS
jgi:hypothetical protein